MYFRQELTKTEPPKDGKYYTIEEIKSKKVDPKTKKTKYLVKFFSYPSFYWIDKSDIVK